MNSFSKPSRALFAAMAVGRPAGPPVAEAAGTMPPGQGSPVGAGRGVGTSSDADTPAVDPDMQMHMAATGRIGGVPTERMFIVQAVADNGQRVELKTTGDAPAVGSTVSFDPQTRQVAR